MKSMTAFARLDSTDTNPSFSWEIRSVNQRFLDLHFKLPDHFKHLEPELRLIIKQKIARGKLDIAFYAHQETSKQLEINKETLQTLTEAVMSVQQQLPEATQVNPLEILNWPGVLQKERAITEDLNAKCLEAFANCLNQLNDNRQREGQSLKATLIEKLEGITQEVQNTRETLPSLLEKQSNKLKNRIHELNQQAELDAQRFHQEVAILAQKMDIQEELDRLLVHVKEVTLTLEKNEPIGRRLDFLMQELNREANTLGSKSIDAQTSQTSVNLKVLIEQMREQIQNIE